MSEAADQTSMPAPSFADATQAVVKAVDAVKAKPWHQSLTVQGAMVSGVAGAVIAYGTPVLMAMGMATGDASDLAKGLAGVLASVGALMGIIGRLRLGGLK